MLLFITPIADLKEYITRIWIFEGDNGLPDNNVVPPNARPKIIIPFTNTITTTTATHSRTCSENGIYFIGVRDVPVILSTPKARSGSIGVEFTTAGAYKLFSQPMHYLVNDLFSFDDCFGNEGRQLQREIADLETPYDKVAHLQAYLLGRIRSSQRVNSIVDYAINQITACHGMIGIHELERKTGYTKRYLDLLFKEYVGIAPKSLSTILRFQHFYKGSGNEKKSIYELYYDESHFIKEFKRYTGYSPKRFSGLSNDFGRHF